MGQLWSTVASMIGPEVDERDLRLAVMMVQDHHEEVVESKTHNVPVNWSRNSHMMDVFVLSPVRTEWDYIEQIFENVPLTTYQTLVDDGIISMLEEIQDFQNDPNSLYQHAWARNPCTSCMFIAEDLDASLNAGPIGRQRYEARNPTLPSRATMHDLHGRPTGLGRSRRVPHIYNLDP